MLLWIIGYVENIILLFLIDNFWYYYWISKEMFEEILIKIGVCFILKYGGGIEGIFLLK